MNRIPNRDQLGHWLNTEMMAISGVEVGCAYGGFAEKLMSSWRSGRLAMVDPWAQQPPDVYRERQETQVTYDEWYRRCIGLALADSRFIPIRMRSTDAAQLFLGGRPLDFVYIDGNHSREAVTDDLNAWWPTLKPGGLIGGHDFLDQEGNGWHCYVKTAVTEWAAGRNLEFYTTPCSSWWIHR